MPDRGAPLGRTDYSSAEMLADAAIHLFGLVGASAVFGYLLANVGPLVTASQWTALITYAVALLGTLTISALYNLSAPGRAKAVLRKLDRAMIFVMIAGSYTPFAICAISPRVGMPLCAVIWTMAAIGVGICLRLQRLYDRLSLALYLGMGWMVLAVLPSLAAAVSTSVLLLLLVGGIVYSAGVLVHRRTGVSFHNAAWHAMVVAAAALHLAAVALILP
ncbi:MAG TPA: hemolysin III family protein [Rhodopila sp.]|nr:hemolysin III family protein [Rhodopila sp.]